MLGRILIRRLSLAVNSVFPTTLTVWRTSLASWARPSAAKWSTTSTETSRRTSPARPSPPATSSTSARRRPEGERAAGEELPWFSQQESVWKENKQVFLFFVFFFTSFSSVWLLGLFLGSEKFEQIQFKQAEFCSSWNFLRPKSYRSSWVRGLSLRLKVYSQMSDRCFCRVFSLATSWPPWARELLTVCYFPQDGLTFII